MTGYGVASFGDQHQEINVEVKTLNSKFLDTNIRIPRTFSDHEIQLRNLVAKKLERGKVTLTLEVTNIGTAAPKVEYNEDLFMTYYEKLTSLSKKAGDDGREIFKLALQSPEVIVPVNDSSEKDTVWKKILPIIESALDQCDAFRVKEGTVLSDKLKDYINQIGISLGEVEVLDPSRIANIKARIKGNLEEFVEEEKIDKNRFEQELIYFIEKLDISEEKVRLKSHLEHFVDVLENGNGQANGKKLGFIAQEVGREINTIGSKANDAAIQKHVVSMKEELEKIKEQVLNFL